MLFLLFLCGIIVFHLWFINSGRFDLAPDEAHYWTWSKRLDWSYYSKGPIVAYLIALSTRMGGDTEFFVRLPAVLLSAGTVLLTFLLTVRLCRSGWAGLEAVLRLGAPADRVSRHQPGDKGTRELGRAGLCRRCGRRRQVATGLTRPQHLYLAMDAQSHIVRLRTGDRVPRQRYRSLSARAYIGWAAASR